MRLKGYGSENSRSTGNCQRVYALVACYMPDPSTYHSSELDELVTECHLKALLITQMITGVCEKDADEALNHSIQRDNCIDQLEKQLKAKREDV